MEWRPAAGIDVGIPRSVDDLGVPEALIHDIVLRQTVSMGRTSTEPRAIDGARLSGGIGGMPSRSAISATFWGQSLSISRP